MRRLLSLVVVALICGSAADTRSAGGASAQPVSTGSARQTVRIPPERIEAVERFVEQNWSRLGLPGVAVSVATAQSVLLATGHGRQTVDGGNITGRTPFHIGSVTKTFTAAAVVELADQGVLDLDAPVETYVADFAMAAPFAARSVTLRQLLQHRSGFRAWDGHDARAQHQGRFDHLSPAGPPGQQARYSSLNFIVLGRVLEAASGQAYASTLRTLLFRPLGMSGAFVDGDGSDGGQRALGHQNWFGMQCSRAEPAAPPYLVPARFVGASAEDLARYGGMLLGGGSFAGTRVLSSRAVAALLGPLDTKGQALGWGRERIDGALVIEHKGNARTTSARVRLVPEHGFAVAVLATTNSGPFFAAVDDLTDGIHAILAGKAAPRPWPREIAFKVALLAGTLLSVAALAHRAFVWRRAGCPTRIDRSARTLARLSLDAAAAVFLLVGIPRIVGVPLLTMWQYFPDLGLALMVSAAAGATSGVLRAFVDSARARQEASIMKASSEPR